MTVFDLILVQDLQNKFNDSSVLEEKFQILDQIDRICDCRYPNGTSTWDDRYFYNQCIFCSKHDL